MPRFYIMQIKYFRQNLPPSFDKSLTCSFCDKAPSPPFFPTRSLRFSSITHHANATQFLGSIAGDVWYLGVAKPSILEMHGYGPSSNTKHSENFSAPGCSDIVQAKVWIQSL
ncbi:hypothetical protein P3S67_027201 [Capsicum chacoense]